ncbi:PREDICTED: putative E3 ubiquitin-protein ligase XBAT34 [Populus euphratica]|uniref:E3 ubiquitin-protein ligase XBAT34 n=1 Tax=Populus euphratica TaxID=75702 RepID=A0AAJ6UJT4_POPEU|nr:PREDICTED: putative E3 ubiquitin-protein ligase XBAT34 [Populus euphratica]XP_011030498.1 PREDICTED: putative E3 ubiquitin-protein ligase XBAT34 [Populus euphratica]
MGQQQSKDEMLYQQVNCGNIEGIKNLCREGARLEWIDKEGKTPLILACLNPQLFNVAKTLIELGANVNAYRPGRTGGTPLHHAAKRGLENTVKLLLSHGANALVMNDDCQTPLEVARAKGYGNVVRAIESHICLFSGWLREFYGPGFLEVLAPRLVSRNIWVVVLPTGSRSPRMPYKLELAIYSRLQDAQPHTLIALWKANLEEPKFHHSDPTVMIVDNSTKTRIKLAPANERDKQQLQWFCDACKGISQVMHPPQFLSTSQNLAVQATAPPSDEDPEIAMAINASIQSAMAEQPIFDTYSSTGASSSTSWNCAVNAGGQGAMDVPAAPPPKTTSSGRAPNEGVSSGSSTQQTKILNSSVADVQTATDAQDSVPSAPPTVDELIEDGPIHYPSIDSSPLDISSLPIENLPENTGEKKEDGGSSSCVICLDAPVEGACIPCGHMVGCMSCLKEIKAKKWGCPVCRATINQVVRLYAV